MNAQLLQNMPQQASVSSRLHSHPCNFADRPIEHILEDVETRVRIMCRVMQVFRYETAGKLDDLERDFEDRGAALEVLYEYVDQQMNTISELRDALDDAGWITLNSLRGVAND